MQSKNTSGYFSFYIDNISIIYSSHSAVGKRVELGNFERAILTAGKRLSLKNLNVIIRAIN